ncbi:MAG: four-carbon acid sugar kinase family protein [Hyphomicrobiaceae bacterium]
MTDGPTSLPDGCLIAWYGDDFTGAAAVMEVLTFSGLSSVLFLGVPTVNQLKDFTGYRGMGIAGVARSKSPDWMDEHLPQIFNVMSTYGAPINHYKTCSTFDSAPHIGSIGKACDIAIPTLGGSWHPLFVAAPEIERYQTFGNLFAGISGVPYRLDRHPVMSRHPITPMHEADITRHLSRQTETPLGLVTLLDLASNPDAALARERRAGAKIIAIDCIDHLSLIEAGRLIWANRGERLFAVGSQGMEYALVAHWRDRGLLRDGRQPEHPGRVDHIAVVSGSCSSITANQIRQARKSGFKAIRVNPALAVDDRAWSNELESAAAAALVGLNEGWDPIVFTSSGPEDHSIVAFQEALEASGKSEEVVNECIGNGLGRLLRNIVDRTGLRRAVISGGDTSSHGASSLGIFALTALAPVAPGAALCRVHSDVSCLAGFEIALKGGQMGGPNYFEMVKNGGHLA